MATVADEIRIDVQLPLFFSSFNVTSSSPRQFQEQNGVTLSFLNSREPTKYKDSKEPTNYTDSKEPTQYPDSKEPTKYQDSKEPTKYQDSKEPTENTRNTKWPTLLFFFSLSTSFLSSSQIQNASLFKAFFQAHKFSNTKLSFKHVK